VNRAEFDALVAAAGEAGRPGRTSGPWTPEEAVAMTEEADLLEAEAREFADAVDRDGGRVPYTSAVVLEGSAGTVVVSASDYAATPVHWHIVAGGHVDRLIHGAELVAVLMKAANRGPA
jgi:hypothetical protein